MSSRAAYRIRQFREALRPRIQPSEREEAKRFLAETLWPLFRSMSPRDQRHCIDVYRQLQERGCQDPHVLTAALLHDVGKGRLTGARIRLWHRVAYVLIAATAPSLLDRLESGHGGLAYLHQHSRRGAMLAEAVGASPEVVDLIARHEDESPTDERLRLLRLADDSS